MPAELIETPMYSALRQKLERNARGTLRWVEAAIAEDPGLEGPSRLALEDGEILDDSAQDLRVVYRPLSPSLIELRMVLDERNIPALT